MTEPETSSEPPGPGSIDLSVEDTSGRLTPDQAKTIQGWARRALEPLDAAGQVRVWVLNDRAMALTHHRLAAIEETTDVLTIDWAGGNAEHVDIEIVVCVDVAQRASAARGHDVERELTLYILHGVLHCLGYDDKTPEDAAAMHAREDELLEAAGLGRVYSRPETGT